MIIKVKLDNWKSYEEATLNIDTLSVLIGLNASGKSNALDALVFLNRIASGSLFTSALQGDGIQTPMRGGLEWAAHKPGNSFSLTVHVRFDETTDYEYSITCAVNEKRCELDAEHLIRSKYRLRQDGKRQNNAGVTRLFWTDPCNPENPTVNARLYNSTRGTPRQAGRNQSLLFQLSGQKLRQEISDGLEEVLTSLRNIFVLDPIPSHMRNYSPLAEKLDGDARNIAGVIAVLSQNKDSSIENTLSQYVSKLPEKDIARVYAETVGRFNADAMLYCEERWSERNDAPTVDARGMSDGTLRFLAVLTALLTRPKGSLLVIEEVDNGLHPSRSSLLLSMLREVGESREVDVLVTTHNPALLDAMGPGMVPFISIAHRNLATGSSELTQVDELAQLPRLLSQGPLGQLSSKGLIEKAIVEEDFSHVIRKAS